MEKFWNFLKGFLLTFCVVVTCIVSVTVATHFDETKKILSTLYWIHDKYLWDSDADTIADGAVRGMMAELGDQYSVYIDEDMMTGFSNKVSGEVFGIGVMVLQKEDGSIIFTGTVKDGAAEKAGVKKGDILQTVDGESMEGKTLDEAVGKMRGKEGEKVKISVLRGEETKKFTIAREKIGTVQTVAGGFLDEDPDIAYLQVTEFSLQTTQQFADEINRLVEEKKDFKGLIIDLRNNPGGEIHAAVDIARIFVPKGPIVHVVDNEGKTSSMNATKPQLKLPVVLLVNENTASAAEIVTGALKETGVATVVGTKTFGKGIIQGVYTFDDGTAIKITEAKYLTPNKNDINGVGIKPDIEVKMDPDAQEDIQLKKAIEVLQAK